MGIEFHDPRGATRTAAEPYTCADTLAESPVIGLLANGFPDSVAFMDAVEHALAVTLPQAEFRRYEKPGASAPATAELVAEMARDCNALVTAYGH